MADGRHGFFRLHFILESTSDWVVGWAEIQRMDGSNGKLLGWACEDSGDPIQVGDAGAIPEPNTFALLALGAAGVTALRRRKSTRESTG